MKTEYTVTREDLKNRQFPKAEVKRIKEEPAGIDKLRLTTLIAKSLNYIKGVKNNEKSKKI